MFYNSWIFAPTDDILPVSCSKDKKRCLDFDVDKVIFKTNILDKSRQLPKSNPDFKVHHQESCNSPLGIRHSVKKYNELAYEMV